MKKITLLFAIILSVTFGSSAMSLKEAFNALSNVPNISVKADYDTPILGFTENGQCAVAEGLNASQIFESGNAVYNVLNQVPLTQMINGGNNHSVAAFVYASPKSIDGIYEVLIVVMSGKEGDIAVLYGDFNEAAKNALQSAPLKMKPDSINIHVSMPNGKTYDIEAD